MFRCCAACLCVVLLAVVTPPAYSAAASEDSKVLRVAFPQSYGFTTTDEAGRRRGIVVDFLNEIAKYTGWSYEYIDVDNDTMVDRFLAGDFDLMGGTYYADGFEEYFAYPQYSCGYSKLVLLARNDDTSIKSYDLDSFNGKTIGVFERNTENIRRLKAYLEINNLNCTLKTYTYEQLMEYSNLTPFLENGEVDLLLGNSAEAGDAFYTAAAFDSQPHYIVAEPDNEEVLEGLNMALGRIYDANPNFAKEVYSSNFPGTENGEPHLSAEDRSYIAGRGPVKVVMPREFHPLICKNNNDNHDGVVPDMLQAIQEYCGLSFEYLYSDSYSDALQAIQTGEAELLGYFIDTEEAAMDYGLVLTAPYTKLDSILVRNKTSSYPAEGLVGGVMEGRSLPEEISAEQVINYKSPNQALSDVNKGKLNFYYGVSANLEYIIQQENYTNIVQVNLVNDSLDISFALGKPASPDLLSILNKAIGNIKQDQQSEISSRNIVSIGENHITLANIIYANPGATVITAAVILCLILTAVLLSSRARVRAADMRMALEQSQANSRAKSEFLSRMSHEIRTPMNAIVGLTDLTAMLDGLPGEAKQNLGKIKVSSNYLLSLINDILDMSRIENGKMELETAPFSLRKLIHEIDSMLRSVAEEQHLTFQTEVELSEGIDVVVGDEVKLRQVIVNLLSNAFKFTPEAGTVILSVSGSISVGREMILNVRVTDSGIGIDEADIKRIFCSFEQVGSNISKSQGTGLGLTISSHIVEMMGGELKVKSKRGKGSEFYFTVTMPMGNLPNEDVTEKAHPGSLEGLRVLVAEDNDLNAEIVKALLETRGAVTVRAENGRAVVEAFKDSEPGEYRLILMDIMMPEMNGLDATRSIRALDRPDAAVPIIAMTANAFQQDMELAMAAGMNAFLSKPVDASRLYEEIMRCLENRTS